jgi:hypothetical protein
MLSTVELVQRELRKTKEAKTINVSPQSTIDETAILRRIDALVRLMEDDQRLKNSFVPRIESRYFDAAYTEFNGPIGLDGILNLTPSAPLQSLSSLSFNESNDVDVFTAVDSGNILLLPRGNVSKSQIKLLNSEQWPFNSDNREGAIKVTGEWAWHDDPARRWLDSNDSVKVEINATTTTITVNDADGVDYWQDSPRFSPGQLLKIGSEYLSLRDVTGDTLTVMREQQGSTAATHTAGSTIYIWSGAQAAQDFVTRAAALQYERRGEFIDTKVEGVTEVHWPTAQNLPEYRILLQLHNIGRLFSA